MSFINKIVLVTGASSGIGAASALKFALNGANVAIVGRNEKKLNAVHKKIESMGRKALTIVADVTQDEEATKIINETITDFGKLDVLVNNAGEVVFGSILAEDAMATYDQVMATNLRAAVKLTNLAAKNLIKTRGCIVNISSIASSAVIHATNFPYCTSKAGLDHFTRCIAVELSKYGVRVNSVNPGPVKTDFMDTMGLNKDEQEKLIETLAQSSLLGKVVYPEEVADLIMFLASDMAKSITGSSYAIDNGMLLNGTLRI